MSTSVLLIRDSPPPSSQPRPYSTTPCLYARPCEPSFLHIPNYSCMYPSLSLSAVINLALPSSPHVSSFFKILPRPSALICDWRGIDHWTS